MDLIPHHYFFLKVFSIDDTLLSHQIKLKSDILPKLREELVFQNQFSNLALTMLGHIHERERGRELVFVGIHARRGDRIHVWKQRLVTRSLSLLFSNSQNQNPIAYFILQMFRDSIVGLYEGKFFNHAMDIFRNRINSSKRKVIFLPTSDDYFWIKKHLISRDDVYFSREMIKESRAAKPTFNEIHRSWRDMKLASKGSSSYGVDLAVLARCNHTIMDYGTFGMWAALLAGGKIVLPIGYSAVK